jgi:hypothetical protein
MKSLFFKICFLFLLVFIPSTVRAEDLTLHAKIVDVGWSHKINNGSATKNLFVEFSVINNSNSPQSFWIMKCSWDESFRIDNDEIAFCGRECVGNFPIQINLNPTDSITFTSILEAPETAYKNPSFKIGLFMVSEEHLKSMFDYKHYKEYIKSLKTYWSNTLTLDVDPRGYTRIK